MLLKPEAPGPPAFAIACEVPSRFLGTECFQETHPERIFWDCSHDREVAYTAVQAATMEQALASNCSSHQALLVRFEFPGNTLAQPLWRSIYPRIRFTPKKFHGFVQRMAISTVGRNHQLSAAAFGFRR